LQTNTHLTPPASIPETYFTPDSATPARRTARLAYRRSPPSLIPRAPDLLQGQASGICVRRRRVAPALPPSGAARAFDASTAGDDRPGTTRCRA